MTSTRVAAAALVGLGLLGLSGPLHAHELRPAFVDLQETEDAVEITVSFPLVEAAPRTLEVRLPAACVPVSLPLHEQVDGRVIERGRARCPGVRLAGAEIAIEGLTSGVPEAVVHATLLGSPPLTLVARRERPSVVLGGPSTPSSAGPISFVGLGVRHIFEGIDHLLFVLGLLLLVLRDSAFGGAGLRAVPLRRLLGTVTAFTCAHTLTLALSTLGLVTLPPRGVEAAIALSILSVAVELGRPPSSERSLAARRPWMVAFGFGLLHGFGFAGALRELGLPRPSRLEALLGFNAGVEIGQLAFLAACLLLLSVVRRLSVARVALATRAAVYGLGTMASYWFLERTLTLWR